MLMILGSIRGFTVRHYYYSRAVGSVSHSNESQRNQEG